MPTTPAQGRRKTRNSRTAWLQTEMVFQKQTDRCEQRLPSLSLDDAWLYLGSIPIGWLSSGTPELVSHPPSLLQHNCIPRHLSKRQSFSTVKEDSLATSLLWRGAWLPAEKSNTDTICSAQDTLLGCLPLQTASALPCLGALPVERPLPDVISQAWTRTIS